mgnify:FL=1
MKADKAETVLTSTIRTSPLATNGSIPRGFDVVQIRNDRKILASHHGMMTGRIVLPRLVLGAMGRRQRRWFWILGILIALISTAGAAAMGCAGAKPPSECAQAEVSSSKQTSMAAEPSEATSLHATWQVGSCEVEMRQGLGSTYRFAEAQRSRV